MELGEEASARCIAGLAQAAPFRFVDRVRFLDDTRVVTELHGQGLPHRFVDADEVETWTVLEFAAQSSGLVLRDRKKAGARGVIASFRGVERRSDEALRFPLRLESTLVDDRGPLYGFDFEVHSTAGLAVVGNIVIHIGR